MQLPGSSAQMTLFLLGGLAIEHLNGVCGEHTNSYLGQHRPIGYPRVEVVRTAPTQQSQALTDFHHVGLGRASRKYCIFTSYATS